MLIRPATLDDHAAVLSMAHGAGVGMTSLPHHPEVLEYKIRHSMDSFAGTLEDVGEERFLFILEDDDNKLAVGTTGLVAHVGLTSPFFSYKLSTITQASVSTGIFSLQRVLHMVNDYTGASEIGSLFLTKEYRRDGIGRFLSRCRYLMLAEFPDLFSDIVISEIRGVYDEEHRSPFYDHLARHFFGMHFTEADYISATQGSQFIADLMPKYPIYVTLLPQEAQAVIGVPLETSRPALQMLEDEGFRFQGYLDVFDGGPTVQAERSEIRTVRHSRRCTVKAIENALEGTIYMISNTVLNNFRVCRDSIKMLAEDEAVITTKTAERLQVQVGDAVRFAQA